MTDLNNRTVTFLFTEIDSTLNSVSKVNLAQYDNLIRQTVTAYGGIVFNNIGARTTEYGICAAFSNHLKALDAAIEAQRELVQAKPISVRIALYTGPAQEQNGTYFGPTLNKAARLLAAGHGGQILVSAPTQEILYRQLPSGVDLRNLGQHRLRNLMRPEQVFQIVATGLPHNFAPLNTVDSGAARPNNLPVETSPFVGREEELNAIAALLQQPDVQLLTLTAPDGTGKTRMALQVGNHVLNDFEHGVLFMTLGEVHEPDLLISTITQTCGLLEAHEQQPLENLKDYLQSRQILLILDNFMQAEAATLVPELLKAAPRLKMLVTRQTLLGVEGEQEYALQRLDLPISQTSDTVERIQQYASVKLFVDRARKVNPDFEVNKSNAPVVAALINQLDGMPLAIELAAVRSELFSTRSMLSQLTNRMSEFKTSSSGGGQKILRGAIDWSYNLLEADEKRLFRRLAIFVGGCNLEAASGVCSINDDLMLGVQDRLSSLEKNNLVRQYKIENKITAPLVARSHAEHQAKIRYIVLDSLRDYALERLADNNEREIIEDQYAAYYLVLLQQAEQNLQGADQVAWLERLETEHENLRAALDWLTQKTERLLQALELAGILWQFWWIRGHLSEGRERITNLLERVKAAAPELIKTSAYARLLIGCGYLTRVQSDFATARSFQEEGLAIYRELADKAGVAASVYSLAILTQEQGDYTKSRSYNEEGLGLYRELEDKAGIGNCLNSLGIIAYRQGDFSEARRYWEDTLVMRRSLNDKRGIAKLLNNLGVIHSDDGDFVKARRFYEESLALHRESGDKRSTAGLLNNLGEVIRSLGDYNKASAMHQEALGMSREIGDRIGVALSFQNQAEIAQMQGDYAKALGLHEESLIMYREADDKNSTANALIDIAYILRKQGEYFKAFSFLRESLVLSREMMSKPEIAKGFLGLGIIAIHQRQLLRAAKLLAASQVLRQTIGTNLKARNLDECNREISFLRTQLNKTDFESAWREAWRWPLDNAIDYALSDGN